MEGELRRIRSKFVKRVSIPVIKGLLDDLWQQKVFSTEEKDSLMEEQRSTTDRARFLIDEVMKKGERASQVMIDSMKEMDNHLCITLDLSRNVSSGALRVSGGSGPTGPRPRTAPRPRPAVAEARPAVAEARPAVAEAQFRSTERLATSVGQTALGLRQWKGRPTPFSWIPPTPSTAVLSCFHQAEDTE
ncbi:unnamed protein product [Boreogadus saida]